MMIQKINDILSEVYWIWALIGCILIYIVLSIISSTFGFASLMSNATTAAFLALAALGQMFVISSGPEAIDLSIPAVVTFSAYVTTGVIGGATDERLILGIILVLGVGAFIGFMNSVNVVYLKIPAIIATLAMGNIITTASLIYNEGFAVYEICPILRAIVKNKFLKVPLMIYFLIFILLIAIYILKRTTYGRFLLAVGQNIKAAFLTGIRTNATRIIAFIISGILASIVGMLLSARVGGAFLQMGDPYLLETVGSVVLGGTAIMGGRSTALGTVLGALLLTLVVSTMQVTGLHIGLQQIIKGFIIIAVLSMAAGQKRVQE